MIKVYFKTAAYLARAYSGFSKNLPSLLACLLVHEVCFLSTTEFSQSTVSHLLGGHPIPDKH